nr:MAG TPA: hypothetical protein [Caudoviricetes sp.]
MLRGFPPITRSIWIIGRCLAYLPGCAVRLRDVLRHERNAQLLHK